jgi:hypothetical protein
MPIFAKMSIESQVWNGEILGADIQVQPRGSQGETFAELQKKFEERLYDPSLFHTCDLKGPTRALWRSQRYRIVSKEEIAQQVILKARGGTASVPVPKFRPTEWQKLARAAADLDALIVQQARCVSLP